MALFNPETKIWKGPGKLRPFRESDNIGAVILDVLGTIESKVIQISDESGVKKTAGEIKIDAIRIALGLEEMSYKAKDLCSIVARNNCDVASVLTACFLIGAPVNTLDPTFQESDIQHMFHLTQPKFVFCETDKVETVQKCLNTLQLDSRIFVFSGNKSIAGTTPISELLKRRKNEEKYVPKYHGLATTTIAAILCSSGTTGLSKGVTLTHAQLLVHLETLWDRNADDVVFTFSSLYWYSGFSILVHSLLSGATRITTTEPFTPALFCKIVMEHKVNNMFVPPSLISRLVNDPAIKTANFSSIKIMLCGGSSLAEGLRLKMNSYMGNNYLMPAYGMTECCSCITANRINVPQSVGALVKEMEGKIVDVDDPSIQKGVNEEGELYVKITPNFQGYYGNEIATNDVKDGDWLRTGDIGRFDENGYFYILDRKKDILKYSNYQIAPSEIEEYLMNITGVQMASVVGIPDDAVGDLMAAVIIKNSNATLTEHKINVQTKRELPDYKQLRGGIYFVDELPMTPSGKVVKRQVKEMVIKQYNQANSK